MKTKVVMEKFKRKLMPGDYFVKVSLIFYMKYVFHGPNFVFVVLYL
jgi:hypothetical protein